MSNKVTRLTPQMIQEYTEKGYWKNKTLCDFLKECLEKKPHDITLVDRGYRLSFQDLEVLSNNLTRSLQKRDRLSQTSRWSSVRSKSIGSLTPAT